MTLTVDLDTPQSWATSRMVGRFFGAAVLMMLEVSEPALRALLNRFCKWKINREVRHVNSFLNPAVSARRSPGYRSNGDRRGGFGGAARIPV